MTSIAPPRPQPPAPHRARRWPWVLGLLLVVLVLAIGALVTFSGGGQADPDAGSQATEATKGQLCDEIQNTLTVLDTASRTASAANLRSVAAHASAVGEAGLADAANRLAAVLGEPSDPAIDADETTARQRLTTLCQDY